MKPWKGAGTIHRFHRYHRFEEKREQRGTVGAYAFFICVICENLWMNGNSITTTIPSAFQASRTAIAPRNPGLEDSAGATLPRPSRPKYPNTTSPLAIEHPQ